MGHGDDRTLVIAQMMLEPGNRFRVQVVGGFVEQEDIGLGKEEAGESDPTAFPT